MRTECGHACGGQDLQTRTGWCCGGRLFSEIRRVFMGIKKRVHRRPWFPALLERGRARPRRSAATQSHQPPPARASSLGAPRCWLVTTPSRCSVGTVRDRAQIRTKAALTSTESISGRRLPRRGAQSGVGLPATGSSSRRSGGGLQNAEIAFLGGWYKLETPQPLVSSTQTSLGPSARTPADRGPWGFGKGVVSSDHRS